MHVSHSNAHVFNERDNCLDHNLITTQEEPGPDGGHRVTTID